ncbi:MAG TPA: glycosyltransferase family 39 protein [Saprospiraceae bacterium]|nr:glycosyltransferase family 39 protein [Saprospiraceae bacterium]
MQKVAPFLRFTGIFSISAMLLMLVARLRLLPMPLERDEGAFASIGHALWKGGQLYTTLFDNKPPLLYAVYGGFTHLLGYNATGVHAGLFLFHLATSIFLYLFVKQYFDKNIALLSVAFFSIFALLPNVFGFAAHATQLLLLPALAGLWLITRQPAGWRSMFFGGLFLSAAFLIKQQAIGIIAGAFVLIVWESYLNKGAGTQQTLSRGLSFVAGLVLPVAVTAGWFFIQGRFDDLLRWTVEIPKELLALGTSNTSVLQTYILPYFHGFEPAVGLALLGIALQLKEKSTRQQVLPFALLFVSTLAVTYFGAAFYPHYFVLTLPFFAALCASGTWALYRQMKTGGQYVAALLALLAAGYPVALQSDYFFQPDYKQIHRQAYGLNPFPEMEEIGKSLRIQTKPGDILVLGSEPEILVAAGQLPPNGYPFVLDARMPGSEVFQKATSDYLKNKKPQFVIFVPTVSSWFPGYQQSPFVRDLQMFLQQNYVLTGAAQIDKNASKILWNEEARKPPADPTKIGALVFRRKE